MHRGIRSGWGGVGVWPMGSEVNKYFSAGSAAVFYWTQRRTKRPEKRSLRNGCLSTMLWRFCPSGRKAAEFHLYGSHDLSPLASILCSLPSLPSPPLPPPPPSSCRTITLCRRYNYLIHAYMYIQKSIQTSIQTSEQTYVQALLRIFRAALIVNWPWCNFLLLLLLFPSVFRHLLYTVPSHPSHHPSLISHHPLWP